MKKSKTLWLRERIQNQVRDLRLPTKVAPWWRQCKRCVRYTEILTNAEGPEMGFCGSSVGPVIRPTYAESTCKDFRSPPPDILAEKKLLDDALFD